MYRWLRKAVPVDSLYSRTSIRPSVLPFWRSLFFSSSVSTDHPTRRGDVARVRSLALPHLGDQLVADLCQLLDLFVLEDTTVRWGLGVPLASPSLLVSRGGADLPSAPACAPGSPPSSAPSLNWPGRQPAPVWTWPAPGLSRNWPWNYRQLQIVEESLCADTHYIKFPSSY